MIMSVICREGGGGYIPDSKSYGYTICYGV